MSVNAAAPPQVSMSALRTPPWMASSGRNGTSRRAKPSASSATRTPRTWLNGIRCSMKSRMISTTFGSQVVMLMRVFVRNIPVNDAPGGGD
jgi:hypothetical protein